MTIITHSGNKSSFLMYFGVGKVAKSVKHVIHTGYLLV